MDAKQIQQYRPIYVLNVSFKIFTKVGTNRLNKVAQTVVSPSQTAFMPSRNIMNEVVILHETIHELHTKKRDGVIFKIDFEKGYGKVKWSFLQQTLRMKEFSSKSLPQVQAKTNYSHFWRGLIKSKEILTCGSFEIKDWEQTRFWKDTWMGQRPFKDQYPTIYNIARQSHA